MEKIVTLWSVYEPFTGDGLLYCSDNKEDIINSCIESKFFFRFIVPPVKLKCTINENNGVEYEIINENEKCYDSKYKYFANSCSVLCRRDLDGTNEKPIIHSTANPYIEPFKPEEWYSTILRIYFKEIENLFIKQ